jgi:hypothetical protein
MLVLRPKSSTLFVIELARNRRLAMLCEFRLFNPFNGPLPVLRNDTLNILIWSVNWLSAILLILHLIATPGAVPDSSVKAIVPQVFAGALILAGDFNRERAMYW